MGFATSTSWYRLHQVTIIALCLVVGAVTYEQTVASLGMNEHRGNSYRLDKYFGWPFDHLQVYETVLSDGSAKLRIEYEYYWRYLWLIANTLLSVLLVASTIFVVESWMRSSTRWQLSLGTYLGFITICGVLIAILNGTIESMLGPFWAGDFDGLTWDSLRSISRWPLLFALGCTIYTLAWLVRNTALLDSRNLYRRRRNV